MTHTQIADSLLALAKSDDVVEYIRTVIEDELIERRDARIGIIGCANGLVVREKNSDPSSIIRMTTAEAIMLTLETLAASIKRGPMGVGPIDQ